ncbi:hypothetical protein BASA81_001470 [Batrachochytrium salamandrivorans]|nr:hypothetical protein BASA81_001470 [Batrachochytrium salamandrivorans]
MQARLSRYCAEEIREQCVMCVDPWACKGISSPPWPMLEQRLVLNVINLVDYQSLFDPAADAACLDSDSKLDLLVVLITSGEGEELLAKLRVENQQRFRIQLVPAGVYGLVPASAVGSAFTLALEPCVAPTPFQFGVSRTANPFELDLQSEVPLKYRNKLKRVAGALFAAIEGQLEWDVAGHIFSLGFGSSLLANTMCRMDPNNSNNYHVAKASLLLVDRTVDWASAFTASGDYHHTKLHLQLAQQGQLDEIIPHIVGLLSSNLCTQTEALGMAVRALSIAGGAGGGFGRVDGLASKLGVGADTLQRFLSEVVSAKQHCSEEEEADEYGALLPHVLDSIMLQATIPPCVKHADHNLFNNVFKLLASGGNKQLGREVQSRSRLVVFVLGGISQQDLEVVQHALQGREYCLIGTSWFETNRQVSEQLLATLQQRSDASSPQKNFAELFSL